MKSEYDVIVIGAGPAGSIAAREAAGAGLDTLLLEKRQEIGEPVRCAEGVPCESLIQFTDIDKRWICAEISKARLHSPNGNIVELSQQPGDDIAGYVLDRKIFDRALARSAASAGASVETKTQAVSLLKENGTVCGIRGISRGNDFSIRSKIVIGADGIESRVGRWAGIMGALKLKDIGTCAQFHLANIDIETDRCEFYFGSKISPGGYAWIFPKGKGEANVGLGIIGSLIRDKHPIDYLETFVEKTFPDSDILASIVGAMPVCGMPERLSCGGVMLVGDSGRLVDPLLGAGIVNAMRSGKIAGNVAADAISCGDVSANELSKYDRKVRTSIGRTLARNYRVKEIYDRASDHQVDIILSSFKKMNAEHMSLSRIFSAVDSPDIHVFDILKAII